MRLRSYGTQPIDVVKSRIMDQPTDAKGNGVLYRSSFDCFSKTLRQEGFRALFKGSVPNLWRNAPWLLVFFLSYERLRKLAAEFERSRAPPSSSAKSS